jgi:hypothetical protein
MHQRYSFQLLGIGLYLSMQEVTDSMREASHLACRGAILTFHNIPRTSVGADYTHEQIDPGIRMSNSPVMLSAAKHLAAQRDRPFASLRMTG